MFFGHWLNVNQDFPKLKPSILINFFTKDTQIQDDLEVDILRQSDACNPRSKFLAVIRVPLALENLMIYVCNICFVLLQW